MIWLRVRPLLTAVEVSLPLLYPGSGRTTEYCGLSGVVSAIDIEIVTLIEKAYRLARDG
jgi:hypothetical protein